MAVFRVERNSGYTVMSNHHLRNKELTLKAKGLLSQMLSLPEDWDYTLAGLSHINRESIDAIRTAVVGAELRKIGGKRHIAGADLPGPVPYDGVHCKTVILQKLAPYGEQIKLPDLTGRSADAPAQQHIELAAAFAAEPDERRHIQRLEQGHHRVGGIHPKRICLCAGRGVRVNNGRLHIRWSPFCPAHRMIRASSMVAIFSTAPPDIT